MTLRSVRLGSNEFVESEAPLALGDRPLLAFSLGEGGDLLVDLEVPSPPAATPVHVRRNQAAEGTLARANGKRVTISQGDQVLLRASIAGPDSVEVEVLDLRPVGLAIFADSNDLHIGSALVSQNTFVGARFGISIAA